MGEGWASGGASADEGALGAGTGRKARDDGSGVAETSVGRLPETRGEREERER